jgi:hypothetical protein
MDSSQPLDVLRPSTARESAVVANPVDPPYTPQVDADENSRMLPSEDGDDRGLPERSSS